MNKKQTLEMAKALNTGKESNAIRCPACNSTMTYYRRKTADFACRGCGNIWRKS